MKLTTRFLLLCLVLASALSLSLVCSAEESIQRRSLDQFTHTEHKKVYVALTVRSVLVALSRNEDMKNKRENFAQSMMDFGEIQV
jgi:cell division protein FtsW (lipid II flippase)